MLSPSLAQEIAGDTSAVIGFNVLITDADGMVIGSGDSSRVGSFHEASVEVIRTQEPATHNASQAQQLRGVRPGSPAAGHGRAGGRDGRDHGSPAQVRRFGLLVKRQTEILLRESVMLRSRLLAERAAEKLLADIASYDPQVVEGDFLVFRGRRAGLRPDGPAHGGDRRRGRAGAGRDRNGGLPDVARRPECSGPSREIFGAADLVAAMTAGRFAVLPCSGAVPRQTTAAVGPARRTHIAAEHVRIAGRHRRSGARDRRTSGGVRRRR